VPIALLALAALAAPAAGQAAAPPVVVASLPDTTVAEDSGPITLGDLNATFADPEDGTVLAFTISLNSNPGLVTAAIDADSALVLTLAPNQSGSSVLVVRATDGEALSVDDTVVVNVLPVNDQPVAVAAIVDTTVLENGPPIDNYRDLNLVFDDVEDGSALAFSINGNSNPTLVAVSIDADSAIDLSFNPNDEGSATITVRAMDSGGLWLDVSFTVSVHRTYWIVHADGSGQRATIQAALDAMVDGDTLTLSDGVYTGVGNRTLRFNGKSLLLRSENGPDVTVIDCESQDRGFDLTYGEGPGAVITGVTVTNAAQTNGAGFHITNGSPTIVNNVISNCIANRGGGLRITGGAPLLRNNVIIGNTASEGGGIFLSDASPVIEGNTLVGNGAAVGGGIYLRNDSDPVINNTIIAFGTQGPALQCESTAANPTVSCSNVYGNAGGDAICGTDAGDNISVDPLFCGPPASGDVTLVDISPCAPANNICATLIGARPVACGAPGIVVAIPDTTVLEDAAPIDNYVDLNAVFSDQEDGSALSFALQGNTNPALVNVAIDADSAIDLSFAPNASGTSNVTLRASDSAGFFADAGFVVTVVAVNDTPSVSAAIPDTAFMVGPTSLDDYRDLTTVFADVEDGSALAFSVAANSNPDLVTATVDPDSMLDFTIAPQSGGEAVIVVRAADSGGLTVDDTLKIEVIAGNVSLSATRMGDRSLRPGGPVVPLFELTVENMSAFAETLTAVTFSNTSTGPGSMAQLDADFQPMQLSGVGGVTVLAGGAPGSASASFAGGRLAFPGLEVVIPAAGSVTLAVGGGASLGARDGDVLDLALVDSVDVDFAPFARRIAAWPIAPGDVFAVDGMVAAQVTVQPVATPTFAAPSSRNLAFDVVLPANGYEADQLNRINIVNLGTAAAISDIARMEAWIDDGDGAFDALADAPLGEFSYTGSRWELTGLASSVPLAGIRVFVTLDVSQTAGEGRTVQLALPGWPDLGVGMDSGNDGPLDAAVANPAVQSIVSSESVVLTAATVGPIGAVPPGAADVTLMEFVMTNNYAVTKRVTELVVRNASNSPAGATQQQLDEEIEVVRLRLDGDGDGQLDDEATDPVLDSSFFSNGRAVFTSPGIDINAGASSRYFVTADVSLRRARDGDNLAAGVSGAFDIDFADATAVVGNWPLDSAPGVVIDGMLAAQVMNLPVAAATLGPNDGPVLALDVVLPGNGYADDVLTGLELTNLGSASSTDLAEMRLWRDGGDGVLDSGAGDDVDIAPLIFTGGSWKTPVINEPLPAAGTRFFVTVIVAAAPSDSTSVRLSLPIDGVSVASSNDGPRDTPVISEQSLLLSTAPLVVTMSASPAVSTVGQPVEVRMVVRNQSAEAIDGVTPAPLSLIGDAGFALQGGPQPPTINLAVGAVDTISWTYVSSNAGTMAWSGSATGTGAVSGLSRTSLGVSSNTHRVFDEAGDIALFSTETMPFQVGRGQANVVPLNLTFGTSGGSSTSNARILGLRVRIEDGQGNAIVPSDLLQRVAVGEGSETYLTKTSIESSGSEVDLTLATPVVIPAGEQATLSLRLDVLASTSVPEFRVVIVDSTWFASEDAINGGPLDVKLQTGTFPIRSSVARVVVPPTELRVLPVATTDASAGRGQTDVSLIEVEFDNPGVDGITTGINIGSFAVTVTDSEGTTLNTPWEVFERIEVTGPVGVQAARALGPQDGAKIALALAPLAGVAVNTPIRLAVTADLAPTAPLGTYLVSLTGASDVDARDATTGAPVPVTYVTNPISGGRIGVEAVADSLYCRGTPGFPSSLKVGSANVRAFGLRLRHPGGVGVGRIRVDELVLQTQNELRSPLVAELFLDRIRLLDGPTEIASVTNLPANDGPISIPVGSLLLEPGQTIDLDCRVDISAAAPRAFLEIVIAADGVVSMDANLGTATVVAVEGGGDFPMTSGLTQLLPPATELIVGMEDHMPAVLVADERDLEVATMTLTNSAQDGAGTIELDHLVFRAGDGARNTLPVGEAVERITVLSGGTQLGESAPLTADSLTAWVPLASPVVLSPQQPLQMEVLLDLRAGTSTRSLRLGLARSDVGVVQPVSALLHVNVVADAGSTFPLWTEAGNFSGLSLRESFSNFPNPFAAGGEATTFVYNLTRTASVTLRIRTARGESVTTIRSDESRGAGLYQDDVWDGRNGRGVAVVNGVYIAELIVRYQDGQSERLLRKVAVVR